MSINSNKLNRLNNELFYLANRIEDKIDSIVDKRYLPYHVQEAFEDYVFSVISDIKLDQIVLALMASCDNETEVEKSIDIEDFYLEKEDDGYIGADHYLERMNSAIEETPAFFDSIVNLSEDAQLAINRSINSKINPHGYNCHVDLFTPLIDAEEKVFCITDIRVTVTKVK